MVVVKSMLSIKGKGEKRMSAKLFWKQFWVLFTFSLLGVFMIIPTIEITLSQVLKDIPNKPDLPLAVLAGLSLINPIILLIVAIVIGIFLTPRLGLKSHIVENMARKAKLWPSLRSDINQAIMLGMMVTVIYYLFDLIFQQWLPSSFHLNTQSRSLVVTLGGIFYGGISEEIMMRWGLMSFVAWMGWRFFQHRKNRPKPWIMWLSILISSLLFGVAHLGANTVLAPLTWFIFFRMMLLNGIAGIAFGWLFWKRSLEAAMMAHATVHIVITMMVWLKAMV